MNLHAYARWTTAILCFFVIQTIPIEAQRSIPDDNLAYPVLVNLTSCPGIPNITGSGFFINAENATYFVTARHVLFDESKPDRPLRCKQAELLSYSRDQKEAGRNLLALDLALLSANNDVKAHPTHDVAVIRIGTSSKLDAKPVIKMLTGVQIRESAPSGILGVSPTVIKKLDQVLTANEIYVFGFPTSIGLRELPQIDYLKTLIRQGIVAGTNGQRKVIILDCLTFPGNSGGPVLEVEQVSLLERRFYVIGVISQFVPIAETWVNKTFNYSNTQIYNSGYSVAIPMDMVLELLN
jgi:S1-C subfamily serine protease